MNPKPTRESPDFDPDKTHLVQPSGTKDFDPNKTHTHLPESSRVNLDATIAITSGVPIPTPVANPDLNQTYLTRQVIKDATDPLGLESDDELPELAALESLDEFAKWLTDNEHDLHIQIRLSNGARNLKTFGFDYVKIPEKYRKTFLRLAKKAGLDNKIANAPSA